MLIWTAKFSRKKAVAAVITMGVVMAALIILMGRMPSEGPDEAPLLPDKPQRVAYLQSLGWEVETEPVETLQFLLPDTLAEPYLSYNRLQTAQGFDLAACCGKQVSRYTYTVTNYPSGDSGVLAGLLIYRNTVIGGDVLSTDLGGFIHGLARPG